MVGLKKGKTQEYKIIQKKSNRNYLPSDKKYLSELVHQLNDHSLTYHIIKIVSSA
jgi:hypothetical protein